MHLRHNALEDIVGTYKSCRGFEMDQKYTIAGLLAVVLTVFDACRPTVAAYIDTASSTIEVPHNNKTAS